MPLTILLQVEARQIHLMAGERRNMSIDADPQQQKAAPPRMLVVRSFLRSVAWR